MRRRIFAWPGDKRGCLICPMYLLPSTQNYRMSAACVLFLFPEIPWPFVYILWALLLSWHIILKIRFEPKYVLLSEQSQYTSTGFSGSCTSEYPESDAMWSVCLSLLQKAMEKRDVCLRGCLRDHRSFHPNCTIFLQLYSTKLLSNVSSSSTDVYLLFLIQTRRNNLCECIWSPSKVSTDLWCAIVFVLHYHAQNCKVPLERLQFPAHVCSLPLPLRISKSFSKLATRHTMASS